MSSYFFADVAEEREWRRLRLLEQTCDEATEWLLDATGITAGWRCLEVGAGAGSVLRLLADRVGEQGQVVGIDRNTRFLRDLDHPAIQVLESELADFSDESGFDLVHARYCLIHNREPVQLLRILFGLLRPGGYLVLEEPDFDSAQWIDPKYEQVGNRFHAATCALFRNAGFDSAYGEHLPLQVKGQGFDMLHVETTVHLEAGGGPFALLMAESADVLRAEYLATGILEAEDIDRYIAAARDPASFAVYYTTVGVVARKLTR